MGKQSAKLFDKPLERVLLSTITLNNQALSEAISILKPSDFSDNHSREIFKAILKCAESGMVPDMPTIYSTMQDMSATPETLDVLYGLAKTPSSINYPEIILKIKNYSELRFLSSFIEEQKESLQSPGADAEKIISNLQLLARRQTTTKKSSVISFDDLMSMDFPEQKFLIPGILPEGVSLLAAKPKAGKSWLGLDLCVSLAIGGRVLGQCVDMRNTMLLALEDSQRRLHSRIQKQSQGERLSLPNCHFDTAWPTGADGLIKLENECRARHTQFFVIDTYGRFSPARDNNDYSEHTAMMAGIKNFATDNNVSVLLIHHTKKGDDVADFTDRALGSIGITGGVDSILILERKRGQNDGILSLTGRDCEEQELGVKFDTMTCRWSVTGPAAEVTESRERSEIIEVLKKSNAPMSPKDIAERLDRKVGNVKFLLSKMLEDGQIIKPYRGEYKALPIKNTNLTICNNLSNSANFTNFEDIKELDFE